MRLHAPLCTFLHRPWAVCGPWTRAQPRQPPSLLPIGMLLPALLLLVYEELVLTELRFVQDLELFVQRLEQHLNAGSAVAYAHAVFVCLAAHHLRLYSLLASPNATLALLALVVADEAVPRFLYTRYTYISPRVRRLAHTPATSTRDLLLALLLTAPMRRITVYPLLLKRLAQHAPHNTHCYFSQCHAKLSRLVAAVNASATLRGLGSWDGAALLAWPACMRPALTAPLFSGSLLACWVENGATGCRVTTHMCLCFLYPHHFLVAEESLRADQRVWWCVDLRAAVVVLELANPAMEAWQRSGNDYASTGMVVVPVHRRLHPYTFKMVAERQFARFEVVLAAADSQAHCSWTLLLHELVRLVNSPYVPSSTRPYPASQSGATATVVVPPGAVPREVCVARTAGLKMRGHAGTSSYAGRTVPVELVYNPPSRRRCYEWSSGHRPRS